MKGGFTSFCHPLTTPLLWHKCFTVNFGKFLITSFLQNTSGRLLLNWVRLWHWQSFRENLLKQSFADVLQIGALKNFTNFTGKHLLWSLFLIKLLAWMPKKCNMNRVQLEATREKAQHERSETHKKMQHENGTTWKEFNMKKVWHGTSRTRKVYNTK